MWCRLDDLKSWVSENSSISAQHVVALTSQGRSVKLASLHGEVGRNSKMSSVKALTAFTEGDLHLRHPNNSAVIVEGCPVTRFEDAPATTVFSPNRAEHDRRCHGDRVMAVAVQRKTCVGFAIGG
jgi:hypothetical protein